MREDDRNVETPRRGVSAHAAPNNDTPRYRNRYRIESARLPGWDYTANAYYFVTICTRNREHTLGEITGDHVALSPAGQIVDEEWRHTADVRPDVALDEYIVMPNHMHGIIVIQRGAASNGIGTTKETPRRGVSTSRWTSGSLGAIIGQFKGMCTRRIRALSVTDFGWQPRFYDHIVRDEDSLNRIRQYIVDNPLKWELEPETPANLWM